jgi:hypothetical protein
MYDLNVVLFPSATSLGHSVTLTAEWRIWTCQRMITAYLKMTPYSLSQIYQRFEAFTVFILKVED